MRYIFSCSRMCDKILPNQNSREESWQEDRRRSNIGSISEYCELKEVSYESARRWISLLKKEREGKGPEKEALELVEVGMPTSEASRSGTGVKLLRDGIEVHLDKNFDQETLLQALPVLRILACSASAVKNDTSEWFYPQSQIQHSVKPDSCFRPELTTIFCAFRRGVLFIRPPVSPFYETVTLLFYAPVDMLTSEHQISKTAIMFPGRAAYPLEHLPRRQRAFAGISARPSVSS